MNQEDSEHNEVDGMKKGAVSNRIDMFSDGYSLRQYLVSSDESDFKSDTQTLARKMELRMISGSMISVCSCF